MDCNWIFWQLALRPWPSLKSLLYYTRYKRSQREGPVTNQCFCWENIIVHIRYWFRAPRQPHNAGFVHLLWWTVWGHWKLFFPGARTNHRHMTWCQLTFHLCKTTAEEGIAWFGSTAWGGLLMMRRWSEGRLLTGGYLWNQHAFSTMALYLISKM